MPDSATQQQPTVPTPFVSYYKYVHSQKFCLVLTDEPIPFASGMGWHTVARKSLRQLCFDVYTS